MAEPTNDLERVVREVLAELGLAPESGADRAAPADASPAPPPATGESGAAAKNAHGELAVASRVVTLAEVEGRLEGVRRLVVPAEAVVTPSVRDELHRRRIALVVGRGGDGSVDGAVRLVVAVPGSRLDPLPLCRALESEGVEIETHRIDCLVAATDRLAEAVGEPDTLGLVLSGHPSVAVCLANRHAGVRAVWGIDPVEAAAETASVGANVLVVNPRSTAFFPMKQMVSQFCRAGVRDCPEALRERLG
jgi:ribose 5-phosphate isomerase RpiB